tara:strand:+ start:67 stop:429 length:363 start_codon:yes stop_codon:yes gene_type:complete
MTEKKNEIWTIEELVSLTETIQTKELEYNGKTIPLQWCELTESEEPQMGLPDASLSEEEQNSHFAKLAGARVLNMISKANDKNPDGAVITPESWPKLPTTLRWQVSNAIMQSDNKTQADF